ncbi:nucleoid-associated protein [Myroides odoratimimus]|nr:nucleoid-associated protein [Myroides odoratimimus]
MVSIFTLSQYETFHTKKYLKFYQEFAKAVVLPAEDKNEEIVFLNRSVNCFAKNNDFKETNSLNEVIDTPDLIAELKNYKVDNAEKYSIENLTDFPITNKAVTEFS